MRELNQEDGTTSTLLRAGLFCFEESQLNKFLSVSELFSLRLLPRSRGPGAETSTSFIIILEKKGTLQILTPDFISDSLNYVVELLYNDYYDNVMANLNKMKDIHRYYNWYHGYSEVNLPLRGT